MTAKSNSFFSYQGDNNATLSLLNIVPGVHFTGLTAGPRNVEGGKYSNIFFATTDVGGLYAFDSNGQLAPIFVNGQTSVQAACSPGCFLRVFDFEGLAFSTLDYNLWHATPTGGNDPGHGIESSFDFQTGRAALGGTSFNFGLEDPTKIGGLNSDFAQPGSQNYIPGLDNGAESRLLSGNQNLFGSYNLPGGALGSLRRPRLASKAIRPPTSRRCISTTPPTPKGPIARTRPCATACASLPRRTT